MRNNVALAIVPIIDMKRLQITLLVPHKGGTNKFLAPLSDIARQPLATGLCSRIVNRIMTGQEACLEKGSIALCLNHFQNASHDQRRYKL